MQKTQVGINHNDHNNDTVNYYSDNHDNDTDNYYSNNNTSTITYYDTKKILKNEKKN